MMQGCKVNYQDQDVVSNILNCDAFV